MLHKKSPFIKYFKYPAVQPPHALPNRNKARRISGASCLSEPFFHFHFTAGKLNHEQKGNKYAKLFDLNHLLAHTKKPRKRLLILLWKRKGFKKKWAV
jgi:hypothetical protein